MGPNGFRETPDTDGDNPFANPMALMQKLQNDDGIAGLMQEPIFQTPEGDQYSFADLLADTINIQRLHAAKFADIHGADVDVTKTTPEQMAQRLAAAVQGNSAPFVEVFNDLEDMQDAALAEELTADDYDEFQTIKTSQLYTAGDADGQE